MKISRVQAERIAEQSGVVGANLFLALQASQAVLDAETAFVKAEKRLTRQALSLHKILRAAQVIPPGTEWRGKDAGRNALDAADSALKGYFLSLPKGSPKPGECTALGLALKRATKR